MGLPVVSILRALGPLIISAREIVATYRSAENSGRIEDRIALIEQEALRTGEILRAVTEQLEAVAQELRRQAELQQVLERRMRLLTVVAAVAAVLAVGAAVMALVR
jgi:Mg2+ and Co2+ transporter CorA